MLITFSYYLPNKFYSVKKFSHLKLPSEIASQHFYLGVFDNEQFNYIFGKIKGTKQLISDVHLHFYYSRTRDSQRGWEEKIKENLKRTYNYLMNSQFACRR